MAQFIFIKDYHAEGSSYCPPSTTCAGVGLIHDFKKGDIIEGEGQCTPDSIGGNGKPSCRYRLIDKNIGEFSFVGGSTIEWMPFREYKNGKIVEPNQNSILTSKNIIIAILILLILVLIFKNN